MNTRWMLFRKYVAECIRNPQLAVMRWFAFGWCLFLVCSIARSEPTEAREWVSVTGSKVTGSALSVRAGKVLFKLADGRELAVPMDKLSTADQEFLTGHFGKEAAEPPAGVAAGSGAEFITDGLAHKIGEVVGPIANGEGSNYFLYIPKTLRKGRLAPLMHVNDATGCNANNVKGFIEGAEICGWIVAASVESKNGNPSEKNFGFAKANVKHITANLPVDPERIYFTGGSGGGAMSFYNAAKLPGAGSMPQIGYIPDGAVPRGGDHFVCGGATDYNRYTSANAAKTIGKRAIHRLYVGGHGGAPPWLRTEGIAWLNGRFLERNKRSGDFADECLDYELSMIEWIGILSSTEPHRAYFWCLFLKEEYKITGTNATILGAITSKLAADGNNASYVEGIAEIGEFSEKHYSDMGAGSAFKHTTPRITSAAGKLAEKYGGVPMIPEILTEMGKPTVGR